MAVNKKYAEWYGDEEEDEEEKEPMMMESGEDKPDEMAAEWFLEWTKLTTKTKYGTL